jgi:hypothetical protein
MFEHSKLSGLGSDHAIVSRNFKHHAARFEAGSAGNPYSMRLMLVVIRVDALNPWRAP